MADQLAGGEKLVGWMSGACAVHCLAHPALVLVLPMAAAGERVEGVLLAGLVFIAAAMLWLGLRRHGEWLPALPVVAAMALWTVALLGVVPEPVKALLVGGGGLLSFWGLTWSRRCLPECDAGTHGSSPA
jgi:hypothetical protein